MVFYNLVSTYVLCKGFKLMHEYQAPSQNDGRDQESRLQQPLNNNQNQGDGLYPALGNPMGRPGQQ